MQRRTMDTNTASQLSKQMVCPASWSGVRVPQALSGLPGLASRWHLVSNRGRQSMASLTGSSSIWIRASTPLCRTSSGEVQEVSVRTSRSQSGSSWLSAISRSWYTRSRDAMVSGTCSTSFSRRAGPAASACWNA